MKYSVLIFLSSVLLSGFTHAQDLTRKSIKEIQITLDDGKYNQTVSLEFCTGMFKGIGAVIWNNDLFELFKPSICAESTKDCQRLETIWNTKSTNDASFLPSYLVVYDAKSTAKLVREIVQKAHERNNLTTFESHMLNLIKEKTREAITDKQQKKTLSNFQNSLLNSALVIEESVENFTPSVEDVQKKSLALDGSAFIERDNSVNNSYKGSQLMLTVSGLGIMATCGTTDHPP